MRKTKFENKKQKRNAKMRKQNSKSEKGTLFSFPFRFSALPHFHFNNNDTGPINHPAFG